MDIQQLETQFPSIFRACVAEGVAQERDRVTAHLEAGEKVGDLKAAIGAVLRGAELTPEIMRHYLAAGRNRAELAAWLEDSDDVDDAILNAKRPPSAFTDPEAAAVFDRLSALVNDGDGDMAIEDLE
jgi:hypothetical protein